MCQTSESCLEGKKGVKRYRGGEKRTAEKAEKVPARKKAVEKGRHVPGAMGVAKSTAVRSPAASVQARREQRSKVSPFERLAMEDAAIAQKEFKKLRKPRSSGGGGGMVKVELSNVNFDSQR